MNVLRLMDGMFMSMIFEKLAQCCEREIALLKNFLRLASANLFQLRGRYISRIFVSRDVSGCSFRKFVFDKIHIYFADILSINFTPVSTLILIFDMVENRCGDINVSDFSITLHSARDVHGASPDVVGVFFATYYSRN